MTGKLSSGTLLNSTKNFLLHYRIGKKKPGSDKKDANLGGSFVNLPVGYDFLPLRRLSSDHEGGSRGPSGPASPIITSPIHSPPFMQGTGEGNCFVIGGLKC